MIASLSAVDLAYQLRAGAEILGGAPVGRADTWTFTAAGRPWLDQQWGAQVVLEIVHRLAGWTGLVVLRAGLVGATFASLMLIALRRGLSPKHAALLTLAAFVVAAPALALRPQLFGMALFALVLLLVMERRRYPRSLWAIPIIVLVWANTHGSFVFAPVILGLAWFADVAEGRRVARQTLAVGVASLVTACVTPYGPAVWGYAAGLATNPDVTRRISEWQPTTLRDTTGVLFFVSLALIAAIFARREGSAGWPTLAWIAVFASIGLYAQRGVAWWSLAGAVALVETWPLHAASQPPATPPRLRRMNGVLAVLLAVATVALLPAWRPTDPVTGAPTGILTDAPPGVTAALRLMAEPGDRVFNPQPWGSWFEFAVPTVLVALDSRIEFFGSETWEQYDRVVSGGEGWERQLSAWDVAIVVVEDADGAFAARLSDAGWVRGYADSEGAVFRRATDSAWADPSS